MVQKTLVWNMCGMILSTIIILKLLCSFPGALEITGTIFNKKYNVYEKNFGSTKLNGLF